jgi:hypothetical protein
MLIHHCPSFSCWKPSLLSLYYSLSLSAFLEMEWLGEWKLVTAAAAAAAVVLD